MEKYWQQPSCYSVNTLKRNSLDCSIGKDGMRMEQYLNGEWFFKFFDSVNKITEDMFSADFDCYSFDKITVPSEWQLKGYDTPIYTNTAYPYPINVHDIKHPSIDDSINPCGVYFIDFTVEKAYSMLKLEFDGINSCGLVYINGSFVGYSEDTFDISAYDITSFVKEGKNRLTVLVVRFCTGSYLEDQDMWRLSGIFRDVKLLFEPDARFEDLFCYCRLNSEFTNADFKSKIKLGGNFAGKKCIVEIPELGLSREIDTASDIDVCFDGINNIILWSHENPKLYVVNFYISDNGEIIDKRQLNFGFRKIEIIKNGSKGQPYVALNGKLIKICGVNRHDFHPEYGHAVPHSIVDSDLELLKRNNITSVRTCHYPGTRYFYDKCDELGILVMSENNLETHGKAKNIPHNNLAWTENVNYRITNMIMSHRNHVCIIFWSLGNESGVGNAFRSLRETALSLDSTRLIHYEPMHEVSDVVSEMYTSQASMQKIADNKTIIHSRAYWNNMMGYLLTSSAYKNKPFILCEYAHCMGNSLGNFVDYWRDFEANPRLCGGYIWDFADQSIKRVVDGVTQWTMGGDWGDKPNDGVFAFNGIVRADRSPNPALYEVKKLYARIAFSLEGKVLTIINRQSFTNLSAYYLIVTSLKNGKIRKSIPVQLPEIDPLSEGKVILSDELFEKDGETAINVDLFTREQNGCIPKDHLVSYEQFIIKQHALEKKECSGVPKCVKTKFGYEISGKKFKYFFDKKKGGFTEFSLGGLNFLSSPIIPQFWRAYTNNDAYPPLNGFDFNKLLFLTRFRSANKKLKPVHTKASVKNNKLIITTNWRMRFVCGLKTVYTITTDGNVNCKMKFLALTNLIRYGLTFALKKGIDGVEYYGYGPQECYIDRCASQRLGLYKGIASDFTHDYLSPQENGNRVGVRWLKLGKKKVLSIKACGKPFESSVHPYTIDALDSATHLHQLQKTDILTVNIDGGQRGVGGDVPCCSWLKPQYRLWGLKKYEVCFDLYPEEE